mmetsp:Transcript_16846/g.40634  ORF Transcript_16846/g.40634 Transcript_16846/m.40634 type:complete len:213 (+) Transcript_16846:402-1040(+)
MWRRAATLSRETRRRTTGSWRRCSRTNSRSRFSRDCQKTHRSSSQSTTTNSGRQRRRWTHVQRRQVSRKSAPGSTRPPTSHARHRVWTGRSTSQTSGGMREMRRGAAPPQNSSLTPLRWRYPRTCTHTPGHPQCARSSPSTPRHTITQSQQGRLSHAYLRGVQRRLRSSSPLASRCPPPRPDEIKGGALRLEATRFPPPETPLQRMQECVRP